eukprot:297086-Chlamydomonas_euryale.AAC.3
MHAWAHMRATIPRADPHVHPSTLLRAHARTHSCAAELIIHLLLAAREGLKNLPLNDDDLAIAATPLPAPMVAGNEPHTSDHCLLAHNLVKVGWQGRGL